MKTLQPASIRWSKPFIRKIHPWRGFAHCKPPKPNFKTIFKRLSEVRNIAQRDKKRAGASGISKELLEGAWKRIESLEDSTAVPSSRVEAVAAVLLGAIDPVWPRGDEIGADLVHLWAGHGGVDHAAYTMFELWTLQGSDGVVKEFSIANDRMVDYPKPYLVLRTYLASCEENLHSKILEKGKQLWQQAGVAVRCRLAYLFPERKDWVREAFSDWQDARGRDYNFSGFPLLAACSEASLAAELMKVILDENFHYYAVDYLPTLIARLGDEARASVAAYLAQAPDSKCRKQAVLSLAAVQSEEAYLALAPYLDEKTVRALVSDAFKESPELASSVLQEYLRANPKSKAHQALLDTLLATSAVASDPAPEEGPEIPLPPVLADPPWKRQTKKAKALVVKGLEVAVTEEVVHWLPGEPKRIDSKELLGAARSRERAKIMENEMRTGDTTFQSHLLGLRDSEEPLKMLNDWPHKTWNPYGLRGDTLTPLRLLKRFGTKCLPGLIKCSSVAPQEMFEALSRVQSPRLAFLMADAFARRKAQKELAKKWLLRFPYDAALGLIPKALGSAKKERTTAENGLLMLREMGHSDRIVEAGKSYGPEALEALQPLLNRDLLELCPNKVPKLPDWLAAAALPRPVLKSGCELPLSAVEDIAVILSFCPLDSHYEGLRQLREACTAASLERFSWELYSQWDLAGSPAKDDWALRALGQFGGSDTARRLAERVRKWPGDGFSKRASVGLDVLCRIGTDVALQHLYAISEKIRFKALKQAALARVEAIAEKLGFSKDELADRLVPDLGLDASGKRVLDFGQRQFIVSFDHLLKPVVRDAQGKALKNLPKPGKQDDAELAEQATKLWKGLKKDARATAKIQVERLERALVKRRRWQPADFESLLVKHPLMVHLATRLVWGCYADGSLTHTFRVAEDGSPADQCDETATLAGVVGVAHPLEFADSVAAWRAIFDDYELLQPFAQLDRQVYTSDDYSLADFDSMEVESVKLLGMEAKGWQREFIDSGCIAEMSFALNDGFVELSLDPGIYISEPTMNPQQYVGLRLRGVEEGQLAPVQFSELVRTLLSLREG